MVRDFSKRRENFFWDIFTLESKINYDVKRKYIYSQKYLDLQELSKVFTPNENTRFKKEYSPIAHPALLPSIYYLTVEHKSPSPSSIVFAFGPTFDYKMLFAPRREINLV